MPTKATEFKGMPTKPGKLALKSGKFVLTIGATKKELPAGLIDEKALGKLVGSVDVVIKGRDIVAIVPKKPPFRCVLCYIPKPDLYKGLLQEMRDRIAQDLVNQKVISEEFIAAFK